MRKLPHVTLLFWILKTLAVTLGETAGDLFGITLKIGYVVTAAIFMVFFLVVVVAQIKAKRFHPALFWAVVLGTSMVGTEISDFLDRGPGSGSAANGVGYGWGAIILTSLLVITFVVWWRTGQTFDVEKITSRKGEILYWIAILISNTLGTASGDWLAHGTGLGFRGAFFVIAGIMLAIVAAHYLTNINAMVLFWLAFVLTRPLGAAGGDSLIKPVAEGGLGWGALGGSVALFALLAVLVVYQTYRVRRQPLEPLPYPVSRLTGLPQRPNGAVITHTPDRGGGHRVHTADSRTAQMSRRSEQGVPLRNMSVRHEALFVRPQVRGRPRSDEV
ncbi:COG4705 family protein [Streptosporangium canum]|uniref:COG4705 family protein n=1 Tax=Streptosporangium canum TaxID=324952 RepID=UPI0033A836AC